MARRRLKRLTARLSDAQQTGTAMRTGRGFTSSPMAAAQNGGCSCFAGRHRARRDRALREMGLGGLSGHLADAREKAGAARQVRERAQPH